MWRIDPAISDANRARLLPAAGDIDRDGLSTNALARTQGHGQISRCRAPAGWAR